MANIENASMHENEENIENESMHEDEEDDLQRFAQVLARLQFDAMPLVASSIRKELCRATNDLPVSSQKCEVDRTPLSGGYHILFVVKFEDGVRWLFRIPASSYSEKHDQRAADSLASEALTMRLLKEKTTIPIPQVYAFDASIDNQLGCPFILMQYVSGKSLYDVWFDESIPESLLHQRRLKSLEDVAKAMIQLEKFRFEKCGEVVVKENGCFSQTVRAMRIVGLEAMWDRDEDDPDASTIYYEAGPFTEAKSLVLMQFSRLEEPGERFIQGWFKLLRLFIDWIPEPAGSPGFVLTHPDFDIQNFLVAEDGALQAIIDWDGVCAMPEWLGPEMYPGWLTRGWDPMMYGYSRPRPGGLKEDSPEELARYRQEYLSIMEKLKTAQKAHGIEKVDVSTTQQSLVVQNVCIAASNMVCTHSIILKIWKEITRLMAPEVFEELEESERKSRQRRLENQQSRKPVDQIESVNENDGENNNSEEFAVEPPHDSNAKANAEDSGTPQNEIIDKMEQLDLEPQETHQKPAQDGDEADNTGSDAENDSIKSDDDNKEDDSDDDDSDEDDSDEDEDGSDNSDDNAKASTSSKKKTEESLDSI